MRLLGLVGLLLLAGCSSLYGPSGNYSGTLTCKGKGSITISGNLQLAAGYGGGGSNTGTIMGDCGEGFTIQRQRERDKDSTEAPPAK